MKLMQRSLMSSAHGGGRRCLPEEDLPCHNRSKYAGMMGLSRWDDGFDQNATLDASGNILGPFTEGQTVKVITEVSNSVGTHTTAPRTIVIGPPVG